MLGIAQDKATIARDGLRVQIARISPDVVLSILRCHQSEQVLARDRTVDRLEEIAAVRLSKSLVVGIVA